MPYVDLNTVHVPTLGEVVPVSWLSQVRENFEALHARGFLGDANPIGGLSSPTEDFRLIHPALVPNRSILVIAYAVMSSGSLASATRAQWSLSVVGSSTPGKTIRSAYPGASTTGLGFDGVGVFRTPDAASGAVDVRISYSGDGMGRGLSVTWSLTQSRVQIIDLGPAA